MVLNVFNLWALGGTAVYRDVDRSLIVDHQFWCGAVVLGHVLYMSAHPEGMLAGFRGGHVLLIACGQRDGQIIEPSSITERPRL